MRIEIAELRQRLERGGRRAGAWHFVGGRILAMLPRGAQPPALSLLPPELQSPEVVLARIDVEETAPYARPLLSRTDLGRAFYLADDSGHALVRLASDGHLHPDVELRLGGAFWEEIEEENEEVRSTYVRVLKTGDEVYVWGRASLAEDADELAAGYRDAPSTVIFTPSAVTSIYDEPSFRRLSAWRALPWYRKLSVLVRNR